MSGMTLSEAVPAIKSWGVEKGIQQNSDAIHQFHKTLEEVNELHEGLIDNDKPAIKDAIGDIFVTLVMQCEFHNFELEDCVNHAYDVISKRNGKIVNGVFVKNGE